MWRLILLVLAVVACPASVLANGAAYRLVDEDGVIRITNAPADPRFEKLSGYTGSTLGLLRVPEGSRGKWAGDVREIAARHSVDPTLVEAVIRVESAGNPWAVSRKGAQGLMQLMPQTANALGVRDAFDPRQNIEGGVRHLRYLIDRYPGNLSLALAAYNAGERAVDQYRGIPPYAETQQYVQKVLGRGPVMSAAAAVPAAPVQLIYRWEDDEGTLTFSNVPPPSTLKLRR
jgi:soluble lytic murein transglycosylase-like protein